MNNKAYKVQKTTIHKILGKMVLFRYFSTYVGKFSTQTNKISIKIMT